ncbi:MAG: PAS domain S-box protein [bacterium]
MPAFGADLTWPSILIGLVFAISGGMWIARQRRRNVALTKQLDALQKTRDEDLDLFDNVSDVIYIHSLDGKILRINNALTNALAYTKKEFVGKSLKDFMDEKYHDRVDFYLDEVKKNGESSGLIYMKHKSGQERIFQYINSIIEKNGKAVAVRGIARDVTEQKKGEKELRDSEERYRRLLRHSPLPMAVHSGGKWVYANESAKELVGARDTNEIIGKYILDFVPPELRQKAKKKIRANLLAGRRVFALEETIHRLDKVELRVELVAIPIVYQGRRAGQVVIRDITDQQRIQDELARAQRLETAGRLAGQIAHDFNNLLAPLTAYPTLIREGLAAGQDIIEFIDEMESAAVKIAEINQQLLALGRRGHYTTELIDLNELIQSLSVIQSLPKAVGIDLNLASDLFLIKGGRAQLTRALTNLLLNASEAMQGVGTLSIKTRNVYLEEAFSGYQTIEQGEYVRVDIADTGCGIDAEIANRIFEPFFTTKEMDRLRGSGLGLSVVHGVVEDHDGFLDFESKRHEGTVFSLYFPICRDALPDVAGQNGFPRGHGEKILFVDDDPTQRTVSLQLLQRLGYQVNAVSSGEEAVSFLRKQPQDLLILDMVMDGIDGTETYRQVLEFHSEQKAIILSGFAMSQRVREAQVLGAGTFVLKPIAPRVLAKAIRKELDKDKRMTTVGLS